MTLNRYFLISCFALSMFSCSDSNDSPVTPPVEPDQPDKPAVAKTVSFTTDVLTRAVVTELGDASEMNVFAKEYQTLGAENFSEVTFKGQNKGGVWQLTPEIKLNKDQKVFLYAAYPYASTHTDPTAIPIDANKQIDYLFSGEGVLASYASPSAKLTLQHALSVLAFNICKSSYAGAGKLQSVKVTGEKYPTSGVLNIEKGSIGGTKPGSVEVKCDYQITADGWTDKLPQTFTLPTESTGSNMSLVFTIDGREYSLAFPVLKIEQGFKYIFRLGLSDRGMVLFADATEKISLKQETDKMPVEGGVSLLQFTYNGKSVTLPQIVGKGMAPGVVDWGDKAQGEMYLSGLSHTYLDGTKHTISVECWNTEEVTFPSMKGIDDIDLSKF